jgi:outer membrane protein OmpA-like peptidoglycan-associated protein
MLGTFALGAAGAASAQETVYVGGSGQAALEVHLDALDQFDRPPPKADRLLRHPGERGGGLGAIVLIPPNALEDTASGSARREQQDMTPEPVPAPEPAVAVALDPVRIEPVPPEPKAVQPEPEPVMAKAPAKVETVASVDEAPEAPKVIKPEARETTAAATATTATALSDTKVASIDRSASGADGSIHIFFDGGSSDIPADALGQITAIANALANDPTQRLQLKAYAAASAESASLARRLSLTRALTVRSALIEQGVRSTRIDVRALGGKDAGDTPDRVDIFIIKR